VSSRSAATASAATGCTERASPGPAGGRFPVVCDRSRPLPDAVFSDELSEHYFERYRAHGGALADREAWRRSCALARLAGGMSQVAFFGSMVRRGVAPVLAVIARQIEPLMPIVRSLVAP
jgi:hypothetical protein